MPPGRKLVKSTFVIVPKGQWIIHVTQYSFVPSGNPRRWARLRWLAHRWWGRDWRVSPTQLYPRVRCLTSLIFDGVDVLRKWCFVEIIWSEALAKNNLIICLTLFDYVYLQIYMHMDGLKIITCFPERMHSSIRKLDLSQDIEGSTF